MKNKKFKILLGIALLLIVAQVVKEWGTMDLVWQERSFDLDLKEFKDNDEEEDEYENPTKRSEFEFNQLKNPLTGQIPAQIRKEEQLFIHNQNADMDQQSDTIGPFRIAFSRQSLSTQGTAMDPPVFVNRGPYNVGGRTRALAIDVADENIILAGGISGGVWRTTDQGASWTRTSALDQHPGVSVIVQDRRAGETNTWFYATGERRGNSASGRGAFYYGNGIYRSTDNGITWDLLPTTAVSGTTGTDPVNTLTPFTVTDEMAIDYSNTTEREIYVAGAGRIVRTTDDFNTFTTVLGDNNNVNNMADVVVTSTGIVYASIGRRFSNGGGGQQGVFRSVDGITWTDITPAGAFETGYWRVELGIDPQNENLVWALSDQFLRRWDDNTQTWTNLSDGLDLPADLNNRNSILDFDTQTYYDQLVSVHPGNSNVVFIGGTNLFRSVDGFTTTTNKRHIAGYSPAQDLSFLYPNHHPDLHKVVYFDSDPNKMLTGDDGGIHLTNNNLANNADFPVEWESLNNGYLSTQFYHADMNNVDIGDPWILGGMQDNGTYITVDTAQQEPWIRIGGGDGAYAAYTYEAIYQSSQFGNVRRRILTDVNTFININPVGDALLESEFLFVNPYGYNLVNQDQMLIGGRQRAFFTPDVRTNPGVGDWLEITTPEITSADANITAMDWSVEPEGVLYMGTDFGQVIKVENTQDITSDVQGEDLPTGAMPGGYINAIKVDPADANHVIVTFTNYGVISIWESTDGGQNWASISGNLEENPDGSGVGPSVRSFEIMPDGNGGNYYFAGTSVGLFMTQTLDGDNTVWTQQSPDLLGDVVVSWLRVRPIEGLVMISTHANGVFTGTYDVGKNAFVNYSYNEAERNYELRANVSFTQGQGLGYQWIKDGVNIEAANDPTFTATEDGVYQVELFFEGQTGSALSNEIVVELPEIPFEATIQRLTPSLEVVMNRTEVTFFLGFSKTAVNFGPSDLQFTDNSVPATLASIREVNPGRGYEISVTEIDGDGFLGLEFVDNQDVEDLEGNPFDGTINPNESYTIENTVTSIDERFINANDEILIDQNPSNGVFYLTLPDTYFGDLEIGIVSSAGRIIRTQSLEDHRSSEQVLIDLRTEADGLYILKVATGEQELTAKLLKQTN
jgi:photosystem II stability/assembly factor-like uncharacterized protein